MRRSNTDFDVELKGIIQDIINNFRSLFSLAPLRNTIREYQKSQYRKGMLEVERQLRPSINFIPSSDRMMENLYNYTEQNLQQHADEVGNQLRQELQRGLLNGEGVEDLKRRIKRVFKDRKQIRNRMKTVIRTEGARAYNMARFEAAQQAEQGGMKLKKWVDVTEDNKSSHICDKDNNPDNAVNKYGTPDKAIPINKEFKIKAKQGNKTVRVSTQYPPFHPNCRTKLMLVKIE